MAKTKTLNAVAFMHPLKSVISTPSNHKSLLYRGLGDYEGMKTEAAAEKVAAGDSSSAGTVESS